MLPCRLPRALGAAFILALSIPAVGGEPAERLNLLKNSGFEEPLEPAWEKRTPDDAGRTLYRGESAGRTGAAAVLENTRPAQTRLRQGNDRSIVIEPGSLVELSAWIKSDQSAEGDATLQIYCMDEGGEILAQPTSAPLAGRFDWTRSRVRTTIPDHAAYVMAYLQTRGGVGKVFFDDAELVVLRPPVPRLPAPKVGLLTDLAADHACLEELKVLFEDGLKPIGPGGAEELRDCVGAIVLYEAEIPESVARIATDFARGGGRVFMDIRSFARTCRTEATAVEVGPVESQPVEQQMSAGLRVVKRDEATAGFEPGQIMPRAGWPEGKLFVLPPGFTLPEMDVLAAGPGGEPGLVRLAVGKGFVVSCDVLSLRQPYYRNVDAYYKYAPLAGALTSPVRLGQYYPKRFTYAEFVDQMRRLAGELPGVRLQEEGPASEDYRLWSLNLGRPGAPLYFLYAAAHGSEWEPGYGLLTFARRLAQGELRDVVNLEKVEIKIMPYLNPWGYDNMRRQNAQGVDLNRQGDFAWEKFQGRDSNNDGRWSAGDYDWKGSAPFSEPETQTYRKIAELPNLYCVLEFHGNTSATNNKLGLLPVTAKPENELAAMEFQRIANERLRGRHLLRQNDEDTVSQYLLDQVRMGGSVPQLKNTSMRDRFGLVIEVTAGYRSTYGTVLQTDVVCELCRALFLAYPPPQTWPERPR